VSVTLFFDAWPRDDPTGDSLGELTHAKDKSFLQNDNAMGLGSVTMNRHDSQYAWLATDNLIRVRRVAGGPFAYDDSRYIGAFWIESGTDVLISPDEQGGEEVTRTGRTVEACLRWAILYPDAFDSRNDRFATKTRTGGFWQILNQTGGEVLAIFLRDLDDRSPDPLPFVDRDFGVLVDSNGDDWSDVDTDWKIPVGTNGLDLLGTLVSGDLWYRMGADMIIHAYESDPGVDHSGSITLAHAVDLEEGADREIHARETVSRALVQGTLENGKLKFREVTDSTVETAVGRREGFVEYQRTPTNAKLDKAGHKFINRQKKRHDGPTSAKVVERTGAVAFTDYQVGDFVKLNIPGEFSNVKVKVYSIQIIERDGGDSDILLGFEESPFDPGTGPEATESGGGSAPGKTCGDCPPLPPYVNPGDTDIYPDCGSTTWPYEGTVTGLSDKIGLADGAPVDTVGWPCFVTGETYHYDITGTATNPNPGAWGYGLAGAAGSPSAAPNVFAVGPFGSFDTPTFHDTGSFVCGAGLSMPGTVWFYSSVADQHHVNASVSVHFKFWPDGSPITESADPPLDGQLHREQFTGDGASDTFQTAYPYAPGSLHVTVNGIAVVVTETDPTTGTFTLPFVPASGAILLVDYQNAGTTPTGGGGIVPVPGGPGADSTGFELKNEGGQSYIKPHGSMGSTETFDPTDGNVHTGTLTADCTATLDDPVGSGFASLEFWIAEDSTGGWAMLFDGSVTEQGTHDTTPDTTQRAIAQTIDGGTSWVWTWISPGGGSGSADLPWFDVTDYGAVHDGSTDDTVAIQNAIDAAEAAGGGVVFFPSGIYQIAGALQDTGRSNSQLVLPILNYLTHESITIELRGEIGPPAIPSVVGAHPLNVGGTILRSSLSSGTGAVIGGWGPSGSVDNFTSVKFIGRDFTLRTVTDPTNTALDLSHVANAELHNVQVDAGSLDVSSISLQTTATSYGFRTPGLDNGAQTVLRNVNVIGFYNGYEIAEHNNGDSVYAWACRNGAKAIGAYHASIFNRMGFYHCINGLFGVGTHYITVLQMNNEHAHSGTWVPSFDVYDPSNVLHGDIRWHAVEATIGVVHTFTVNGGANLHLLELGEDPFATGAPTTADYLVGTSQAGLSAEIVVGTSPGGELGGTWSSPTIDTTHSGSAHTDFIAKAIVDVKGDLIAATAADTVARVAVGTDGQYLKADSAATPGVSWATLPATSGGQHILLADGHSTPFSFSDLLQMDDGSDFMWSDPE
jgi:hypothetical protein